MGGTCGCRVPARFELSLEQARVFGTFVRVTASVYETFRDHLPFRFFTEPSREKLLPDPVQYPGGQTPRTLVLELDDTLVHSMWSRQTGWRTTKRPGARQLLDLHGKRSADPAGCGPRRSSVALIVLFVPAEQASRPFSHIYLHSTRLFCSRSSSRPTPTLFSTNWIRTGTSCTASTAMQLSTRKACISRTSPN